MGSSLLGDRTRKGSYWHSLSELLAVPVYHLLGHLEKVGLQDDADSDSCLPDTLYRVEKSLHDMIPLLIGGNSQMEIALGMLCSLHVYFLPDGIIVLGPFPFYGRYLYKM